MATRATIGKVERDGRGRRVRLVYDGYPTWAGAKLLLHYGAEETIEELVGLGAIYTLGDSPERVEGASIQGSVLDDGKGHITRAMVRDGGYMMSEYGPVETANGIDGVVADCGTGFAYIWTPDGWFGAYGESDDPGVMPLHSFIVEHYNQQYRECVAVRVPGWWMPLCETHNRGHGITDLRTVLPPELLPPDFAPPPGMDLEPLVA